MVEEVLPRLVPYLLLAAFVVYQTRRTAARIRATTDRFIVEREARRREWEAESARQLAAMEAEAAARRAEWDAEQAAYEAEQAALDAAHSSSPPGGRRSTATE